MNMKKLFVLIFVIISFNSFADCGNEHSSGLAKTTTFTNEIFQKAQLEGKVVVINSWNKSCSTCAKQIKILNQAKNEFKDVLFLSFEQTEYKEIAKSLDIDYWTTIVIYQNNKEIYRSIGQTNKEKIYSQIKAL
jgi:thioredoxin 1